MLQRGGWDEEYFQFPQFSESLIFWISNYENQDSKPKPNHNIWIGSAVVFSSSLNVSNTYRFPVDLTWLWAQTLTRKRSGGMSPWCACVDQGCLYRNVSTAVRLYRNVSSAPTHENRKPAVSRKRMETSSTDTEGVSKTIQRIPLSIHPKSAASLSDFHFEIYSLTNADSPRIVFQIVPGGVAHWNAFVPKCTKISLHRNVQSLSLCNSLPKCIEFAPSQRPGKAVVWDEDLHRNV